MLTPTLLDVSRRPAASIKNNAKLAHLLTRADWERRTKLEMRPTPSGIEPKRNFAMRRSAAMKRGGTPDPDEGIRIYERIIKGNDLVPVNYLERGTLCARSVCRMRLMNSTRQTVGFATGFMVGRGTLLTNHHVLPTSGHARFARAEFGYEHDPLGGDRAPVSFDFNLNIPPIIRSNLDFCLIAVMPRSIDGQTELDDFGWITLDPTPGKTREKEYLTIIQHPAGERKQICVRENRLIEYRDTSLWYETDTVAGSSGSPVFNNSWQAVALHHSGVPMTDKKGRILTQGGEPYKPSMKESEIAWLANEGIRMSAILACLREEFPTHQLSRCVLDATLPPLVNGSIAAAVRGGSFPVFVTNGHQEVQLPTPKEHTPYDTTLPSIGFAFETDRRSARRELPTIAPYPSRNGDDLLNRTGYDPNFLGRGRMSVPLPTIKVKKPYNVPMTWGPGGRKTVLPYTRHSVLLSDERRLAIYSAVNVDDTKLHKQHGGDPTWVADPRVGGREVGEKWYKTFPGVRAVGDSPDRHGPFDKGHQTQQEDATWGDTPVAAARASIDTFYYPNASPQVGKFNQGAKAWQGLEDYVIEIFAAKTGKACVISGAVFDGPKAIDKLEPKVNGLKINPKGARSPDPKFLGVKVPKAFYKVVVCHDGQQLRSAAFIMSQEHQLNALKGNPTVEALETLKAPEAGIFYVKLKDVESLTGLDFGDNVHAAETNVLEASIQGRGTEPGIQLRSLADLRL